MRGVLGCIIDAWSSTVLQKFNYPNTSLARGTTSAIPHVETAKPYIPTHLCVPGTLEDDASPKSRKDAKPGIVLQPYLKLKYTAVEYQGFLSKAY